MQDETNPPTPYTVLLDNTPPELHTALKRAADGEAATAWLTGGETPEGGTPAGEHPQRRFLNRTGVSDTGKRWIEWEGEHYENHEEDLEDLKEKADPSMFGGAICKTVEISDPTPFHLNTVYIPEQRPEHTSGEWIPEEMETTPAGTFYAVVEHPEDSESGEPAIYRGMYRLRKDLPHHSAPQPKDDTRVALNIHAERLLSRVFCT